MDPGLLGRLLALEGLGLDVCEVLACAVPAGVEDEPLIVFGLREDAGPCVQEGRGGGYGAVDGLEVGLIGGLRGRGRGRGGKGE